MNACEKRIIHCRPHALSIDFTKKEGEHIPKSKAKKHPPLPRLLSKEIGHTCAPKSRSSLVHTGKRAFELAQEYSITNSRLALGSTLVLGGVLALSQVQSAEAATWRVDAEKTFDAGITHINEFGSDENTITFESAISTVTSSGIEIIRALTIDGAIANNGKVVITSSAGSCIICSNSNITLNNVTLDGNKEAVSAIAVSATEDVTVVLNDVEVKGVSGAAAILVSGEADTTVTINNSSIQDNISGAGAAGPVAGAAGDAGGSIVEVISSAKTTVTISGDTTVSDNTSGAGGAGGSSGTGDSRTSGGAGGAGGSIILLSSSTGDAELIISDTVLISGNATGAGGAGGAGAGAFPNRATGGDGGDGGSVVAVLAAGNYRRACARRPTRARIPPAPSSPAAIHRVKTKARASHPQSRPHPRPIRRTGAEPAGAPWQR